MSYGVELTVLERKKAAVTAERRAKMCRQMLPVVEKLLADGTSYPQLSVQQLLEAGGMSRQTFYVYFVDKADMLYQLVESVTRDLTEAAQTFLTLHAAATREDLRAAMVPFVHKIQPHMRLFKALYDNAGADERSREQLDALFEVVCSAFSVAIRAGQDHGAMRPSIDPEAVSHWLVWMAERGFTQLLVDADDRSVDRFLEGLIDIIWYTLYAQS